MQEHHAAGEKWAQLKDKAVREGWKIGGAAAVMTSAGKGTAGVAVLARSHIGLGTMWQGQLDFSPRSSKGRLTAMWTDGILKGGMLLMSIYLWHSEGLSQRNLDILNAAARIVHYHGGPWLLAGDFNMTADDLRRAEKWLAKIDGKVVATEVATCRSVRGGRVIDLLVIDNRIGGAIQRTWTDMRFPSSPHRAVVIRIRANATRDMVCRVKKARPFPMERPIGCSRRPATLDEKILEDLKDAEKPEFLHHAFEYLYGKAEEELCLQCDLVDDEGETMKEYTGRGTAPTTRMEPVVPRAAGEYGTAPPGLIALKKLMVLFRDMAGLLGSAGKGHVTPSLVAQWHGTIDELWNKRCLLDPIRSIAGDLGSLRNHWYGRIVAARSLALCHIFAVPTLKAWSAEAKKDMDVIASKVKSARKVSWNAWVSEQLKAGAGALHSLTKKVEHPDDVAVLGVDGPSLMLSDVLAVDLKLWKGIWEKFKDTATAPWRGKEGDDAAKLPWVSQLPKFGHKELLRWQGPTRKEQA